MVNVSNNNKLLVLLGMFIGLLIALILWFFTNSCQIWQIDLSKVIASYSLKAAQDGLAKDEIAEDFKTRLAIAVNALPKRVIVVNKGQLLSEQEIIDRTQWFLEKMELDNAKQNQESRNN